MAPRIKAPTAPVLKSPGTSFGRRVGIPETVTESDPYANPGERGVQTRKVRAQFRPQEFERVIYQHGYYLMWRKAAICPCINPETNQVAMNCLFCDGCGFYYFDPIETRGIMSRMERNTKTFEKFGAWVEGSAVITTHATHRMGNRDQIEMLDSVMSHNELFKKGDRRGALSRLPDNHDAVRYRIHNVVQAVLLDEESGEIRKLEKGYQYNVSDNGWFQWLPAAQSIPDGVNVSLLYEYHPVFVVVSHLHAFRDAVLERKSVEPRVESLPVQVTVKLDYLSDTALPRPSLAPGPLPRYGAREVC